MEVEKMMGTARVIVEDCLAVKEGEKVLIITDDGIVNANGLPELREALVKVMEEKNIDPCVLSYQARTKKGAEIPALAEDACMAADVIICCNTNSFLHAAAFPRIYQGGTTNRRILLLPTGVSIGDSDFLERVMPQTKEELYSIADTTKKFGVMFEDGNEHTVHFTAKNGTDLTLKVGQLSGAIQCGIGTEAGSGQVIPSGSLALGVDEGSAEGVLVVDNCISLVNKILDDPIVFRISNGFVQSIDDGVEAANFLAIADTHPEPSEIKFAIAEFGLGFNPKAEVNGSSPEGELVNGSAHIGIGSNATFGGNIFIPAWHVDCIVPKATVEVDGKMILKDGEYLV